MRVYKRNHEDILRTCCWLHSIHLHQHKGFACKFKKIHCLQTMCLNMLQPLNRMMDMPAQCRKVLWNVLILDNSNQCKSTHMCPNRFAASTCWISELSGVSAEAAEFQSLESIYGQTPTVCWSLDVLRFQYATM